MPDAGELFNLNFPGPLAKGLIGGFRRTLEPEICAPFSMRGRGQSSIARRVGDDFGEAVIVDGVERVQKSGDFGCAPLRGECSGA